VEAARMFPPRKKRRGRDYNGFLCGSNKVEAIEDMEKSEGSKVEGEMLKAFVLGATGETGSAVTKQLLKSGKYSKVTTFGRRPFEYDGPNKEILHTEIIDFDNLEKNREIFRGYDVGYSCLGTTRAKSGAEGFRKVDYDYVVNTARIAKEEGVKHFNLLTSMGSNPNSFFLYPKTKGEAEEAIKKMDFERLTIWRPGFLQCDRKESRFGENLYRYLFDPIVSRIAPTAFQIHVDKIGVAMMKNSFTPKKDKVELYENAAIHHIADS